MARRRSFGHGGSRSARLTEWLGPALQDFVNVAAGGATLLGNFSFEDPATIMRTRGMISIVPQVFGADLVINGAFGIGVVSNEAVAAGVASIPEPFSDADWGGWFVWRSFTYRMEFADATALNFIPWQLEIDSKAMRKVQTNDNMVLVAESQVGAFAISSSLRHLIKLP